MNIFLFVSGFALGGIVIGIFSYLRLRDIKNMNSTLLSEKEKETEKLIQQMKDSFSTLSMDALSKNTEEFLKVATERLSKQTQAGEKDLEGKKGLIDQTFKSMKLEMEKVHKTVSELEKDRRQKFGELAEQLKQAKEQTESLNQTTTQLHSALANTQVRGQWGERMAEDVLRLTGFVEGINYRKQQTIQGEDGGGRPDYTFYLPQDRVVHMDVKFPLDNYMKYLEAGNDDERLKYSQQFVKDARKRVDEVLKRGYVDTVAETLDYMLVFIPNEQVYAFLNEHDQGLMDLAMSKKVILCSPMTLYAILAIIRQAVDNFHLERTASEILAVLGTFNKQWGMFVEAMDKVSTRMDSTQKAFAELTTTRKNMLEKPLRKVEELRANERLVESADGLTRLKVIENEKKAKSSSK
jgi:DNA recombination protein RmuC